MDLLEEIYNYGGESFPRGCTTKEVRLAELSIDPLLPVMDFATRPFNWKYFAGELAWYISADLKLDFLKNFSSFWNKLTNVDGTVNSNYGSLLLIEHPAHSTRNGEGFRPIDNQLQWAFNALAKDKYTRQAIAFLNCPYFQYEGNKDFVCTMYLNFWIDKGHLDMKVQMRSNDIFFGLTYDALWFSMIHQSMFLNLKKVYPDLKLGIYHHCADNIHYYDRHYSLVEKLLAEDQPKSPDFKMTRPIFEMNELCPLKDPKGIRSDNSLDYMRRVQEIVSSEDFENMTQEDWKMLITQFYL
jgi:thymidylate synthase